jgi:hypothetical protein
VQIVPVNPKPYLKVSVIVKLKWGMDYKGNLSPFLVQFEPEHFVFQILALLLIKLKSFSYSFPGYLASVNSYINLQVLIWQFGCRTIRVAVY